MPLTPLTLRLTAEGRPPEVSAMLDAIRCVYPARPELDANGRPIYRGPSGRLGWLEAPDKLVAESTEGAYVTLDPREEGWSPAIIPERTQHIAFHRIVPEPTILRIGFARWRRRRWGCSHEARNTYRKGDAVMFDVDQFPLPVLTELSAIFPELIFAVDYGRAGPSEPHAGRVTFEYGRIRNGRAELAAFLDSLRRATNTSKGSK